MPRVDGREEIRVSLFGATAVGKTCVTIQYISNRFLTEHDPTLEDFFETVKKIDSNSPTKICIYDTAGQEEYSSLTGQYMKSGEGFLIVFSLTDRESFDRISTIRDNIVRAKERDGWGDNTPIILIGNKSDLVQERVVSSEEAKSWAAQHNVQYFETSAKTGQNVEAVFAQLIRMVRKMRGGDSSGTAETSTPDSQPNQAAPRKSSINSPPSGKDKCDVQ